MLKFFEKYPGVRAVMSEKEDGSMKLFQAGSEDNRRNFFHKAGLDPEAVFSADLVHGTGVRIMKDSEVKIIPGTDALVTGRKGIFISVTVADCVPVFFYEPGNRIVAIAHAGWRSIVSGIINNTVDKMIETGGEPENLSVAVGPMIQRCHFEIRDDVLDEFRNYEKFIEITEKRKFVDLGGIIKEQLMQKGIKTENIEASGICTFCDRRFFSHRRDKKDRIEAMIAVIGLVNEGFMDKAFL